MHKIPGFGAARHGFDKVTPSMPFGSQRQQPDMSAGPSMPFKPPRDATGVPRQSSAHSSTQSCLSFNVPFSANVAGPEPEDIIHATPGAYQRWTHPEGADTKPPTHQLPIHTTNVENLRKLCKNLSEVSDGRFHASVTCSEPKPVPGLPLGGSSRTLVTNVCLAGEAELVKRTRQRILHETPISLRHDFVDIDQHLVVGPGEDEELGIRNSVIEHMNYVASWTGTDIFLLKPKQFDIETASTTGKLDSSLDQRFRIAVYGDMESAEHAKSRILIMVDQILKRNVAVYRLELTMHTMISGRLRRHVKQIESATNTAIYFPPPFPQIFGYCPPGANRRHEDEIFITATSEQDIYRAKVKLHELVRHAQACVKEVRISPEKVDSIVLERLDKIQNIMDYNGSYILFPQLGAGRGAFRVQSLDMLHVERTIREVMSISGQYYGASWWVTPAEGSPTPSVANINAMLADICISSGAEVGFEKMTFQIYGSDDAVKAALYIINMLPFVQKAQSHIRVKIELANEHKEFVSGKKNGKINKIMSQSNVQVYFDMFNEYNFFIDVSGPNYDATKNGLDLVEQEMPASIAFHVPDQYHKRIIGIGGQHIQRIMKKYSVFVKFSNAQDRGHATKEDDDIKVDNVICRTPARNAQSLDQVKQEIMDMVENSDAEFTSEKVFVNRLYHRELLARMTEIEELEKKWNCKVTFPPTEQAADSIAITGPQFQLPQAIDQFLGMVPEGHEISFKASEELAIYFGTQDFKEKVVNPLKDRYEVELHLHGLSSPAAAEAVKKSGKEIITLSFTRNNAGGLKDCIDFLTDELVAHGLDASTVTGAIPRPNSDSFEESLPFFDSKLLHRADAVNTDSPTRATFGEDSASTNRSFLDKLRKPSSMASFSSLLGSRKSGARSPNSFAKYASNNASKASLASLESQSSSFHNPWNASHDSGLGMDADDGGWPARFTGNNASTGDVRNPFGTHFTGSTASLGSMLPPPGSSSGLPHPSTVNGNGGAIGLAPGDATPKHDTRGSHDSGRPSTSNSANAGVPNHAPKNSGPGPIGPPSRVAMQHQPPAQTSQPEQQQPVQPRPANGAAKAQTDA